MAAKVDKTTTINNGRICTQTSSNHAMNNCLNGPKIRSDTLIQTRFECENIEVGMKIEGGVRNRIQDEDTKLTKRGK